MAQHKPSDMSFPPAILTERAALTSRTVPSMVLSTGTPAPTAPIATDATTGARDRFAIHGNAIVTGGAGALGLRSCDALLQHGLSGLVIFDINPSAPELEKDINMMREKFPDTTISAIAVDVTAEDKVTEAMEEAMRILGSINHLICFVGVVGCVETLQMPVTQWRRILDVNTTGSFICAQAVARQMVKQQDQRGGASGGSITFIASISAHRVNFPQPQAAYNVSKAALLMLKSCLAAEWARYGIRVNSVSPGYMDTVLNEGDGIKEHRRIWAERNPSGRMGVPAELTGAVVLLASEAGSYINGADIVVDGGGIVF